MLFKYWQNGSVCIDRRPNGDHRLSALSWLDMSVRPARTRPPLSNKIALSVKCRPTATASYSTTHKSVDSRASSTVMLLKRSNSVFTSSNPVGKFTCSQSRT